MIRNGVLALVFRGIESSLISLIDLDTATTDSRVPIPLHSTTNSSTRNSATEADRANLKML